MKVISVELIISYFLGFVEKLNGIKLIYTLTFKADVVTKVIWLPNSIFSA